MSYFIAGGKLEGHCKSYLNREEDSKLIELLIKREYVSILSSRQMGKSSLIQRTISDIEKRLNFKTLYFDLSTDSMTTEIKFYSNLLTIIYEKFQIPFEFYKFQDKLKISPVHKLFQEYLIDLPLNSESVLVIFFDEIDSLFRAQVEKKISINFFSTIRSLYNLRGDIPNLRNLLFCLSGVLPPNSLLNDPKSTPFNIGVLIRLKNIEYENIISYENGFTDFNGNKTRLIESIFYWTNGHPYLSQFLCKIIDEYENKQEINNTNIFVHRIVKNYILSDNNTIDNNTHFPNIQQYIMSDKRLRKRGLELYSRLWYGEKIPNNPLNETQEFLKNSGLIMEDNRELIIDNKIYHYYFNDHWIERMSKIINRPFHDQLLYWLKQNKSPKAATLKGKSLKECIAWSKNIDDITQNEIQFLNQCRTNENIKKRKRNYTIISVLGTLLFISTLVFYYRTKEHTDEKNALEEMNSDQLNDHISYLRSHQNEEINPRELFEINNKLRKKYKGYDELQIQYFSSLINKTPYKEGKISEKIFDINILNENEYVYSTSNEIVHFSNNGTRKLIAIDDSIVAFNYNNKKGEVIVTGKNDSLNLIKSSSVALPIYKIKDSIIGVNPLDDKIAVITNSKKIIIVDLDGRITKLLDLKCKVEGYASNNDQLYLLCSNNVIYKYSLEMNDIISICKYPKKGGAILNYNDSLYYTYTDNTTLSYFNLETPEDLKTISYPNRVHSYIISNKMLVALCFDGFYYFYDLSSENSFTLKSTFEINDVLKYRFNKKQVFTVIDKEGSIHNFNLEFHNFIQKDISLREVSTVYQDQGFEIIGNYDNKLALRKDGHRIDLAGHIGGISAIDLSKEHEIIVTSSYDHTIKIWDFEGILKDNIVFDNGGILNLKLIDDGQKLIATCKNSIIYLWNLKTKKYKTFRNHTKMVDAIDVLNDSDVFITGGRDSIVMIWNHNKKRPLRKIKAHKGWVTNIKISPNSKYFLSSSTDGSIILWDINGNIIDKFLGHRDEVWNVCWLSNNSFISNSRDNIFCIWNINGEIVNLFKGNSSHVSKIIKDEDNKKLYIYFLNGEKRIYSL